MSTSVFTHDGMLDVTDRVECYANGKTFTCDCGQGVGVELNTRVVTCATCGNKCIDRKFSQRSPPKVDDEQTKLGGWS